ncbi:MAG TPA: MFS transporter [Micromonosporaceae bacterium]
MHGGALVLVAILLVALNLRAAITGLGALLKELDGGLGLSPTLLGVVTTLPTVAFAGFGALTPRLTRRLGPTRLLVLAMALLAVGQLVRAVTASALVFLIASALALAGIAVSNILLPALVKQYFPTKLGAVTGVYSMVMVIGSALAAAVSVPIAHAAGSWRVGIGVWALLAGVALVPVLIMWRAEARAGAGRQPRYARARSIAVWRRRDLAPALAGPVASGPGADRVRPGRTRLGWAMAGFFGLQSLSAYALMGWLPQIYRDAGFSAETAGLLLAAVIAGGVPIALVMPTVAARRADQRPMVLALAAIMLAAYLGLALAPRAGAPVWTLLLALGQGAFPLALALIGMRSRTSTGTVALSTFAQSAGYLLASVGPFAVGALYEATGGWAAALALLMLAMVIQAVAGMFAARPGSLEDESVKSPSNR